MENTGYDQLVKVVALIPRNLASYQWLRPLFRLRCVCVIMQDTGLIADSCAFSLCSCCKGRGAKTARGQRSEKGMRWKSWIKTDADGWSGLFLFFLKNTKKNPAPALEAYLQRLSNPQTFNQLQKAEMDYSLSVWVLLFFFGNWHQCTANSSPTEITSIQHSDRKRTIVEKKRNDKDKSFKMWVAFWCPDVFYH